MKKTYIYAIAPVIGAGVLAASMVSAHGFGTHLKKPNRIKSAEKREQMLEHKAAALGVEVEYLKSSLESGKNFREILDESGVDRAEVKERMRAHREERLRARLAEKVESGVLTVEEADERFEKMVERGPREHWGKKGGNRRNRDNN